MELQAWKRDKLKYEPGAWYIGVDYQMYTRGPITGFVKAIDVANKKIAWETPNPLPLFSGLLATKSGLLFTGDQRGFFVALDAKTGKELWRFQTGSGINASPMTYELDGKQYVAILSGLGGDPSFYFSSPKGGMLWVFSVDGEVKESDRYSAAVIESALPRKE
jgi:alcohol dehydrogenase (cytochrome c)